MSVLFVLIAASLTLAVMFLGGFIWSARTGQFEDVDTPPMRLLAENDDDGLPGRESESRRRHD